MALTWHVLAPISPAVYPGNIELIVCHTSCVSVGGRRGGGGASVVRGGEAFLPSRPPRASNGELVCVLPDGGSAASLGRGSGGSWPAETLFGGSRVGHLDPAGEES